MSGMTISNMKLMGQSSAMGGQYRRVSIMGEAIIYGDTECESLKCIGKAEWKGNLLADRIQVTGENRVQGYIRCRELHATGEISASGELQANALKVSGFLQADKGCEAETILVKGVISVKGLLNAGDFELKMFGPSVAEEIGGGSITAKPAPASVIKQMFQPGEPARLTANLIEGDIVKLDSTEAKVVRGNQVTIGSGCVIDRLEYRQVVHVHPKASVGELIKL